MNKSTDHTLEGLTLFPAFAWVVIILFAWFVYTLTIELTSVTASLETTAPINAAILKGLSSTTPPLPR